PVAGDDASSRFSPRRLKLRRSLGRNARSERGSLPKHTARLSSPCRCERGQLRHPIALVCCRRSPAKPLKPSDFQSVPPPPSLGFVRVPPYATTRLSLISAFNSLHLNAPTMSNSMDAT